MFNKLKLSSKITILSSVLLLIMTAMGITAGFLFLIACKDSPKSLAKEMYDLGIEYINVNMTDNDAEFDKIEEKMNVLREKIDKLPDDDIKIFQEELAKINKKQMRTNR